MMIFLTISSTMSWNSCSMLKITRDFVHTTARPTSIEKTSADITGMICGISSWKATAGSSRSPSGSVMMFRWGMMAKPAPVDMKAARMLEA